MRTNTSPAFGGAKSTSSMLKGLLASHATAAFVFIEAPKVSSNGIENPDKQLACQRAPKWDFFAQSATCVVFRRSPQRWATGVLLIRHSLCFKNEAACGLEFSFVALLTATLPRFYVGAFVSKPTQSATNLIL
jgi:hypothetical protein